MSKLSAFCDKLIEASWLAAIIMAPLFFDVYSSRVFEPDKISLVRTLALVMATAWLIKGAERLRQPGGASPGGKAPGPTARFRNFVGRVSTGNPLFLPVLALAAAYIVSTVASVSFSVSLLGSYQRMQGTYTTFSYIVIFLLAVSGIRSRAQVDRAITVALLASFPIAFFGVIQHYFLDPLPWSGDTTTRVAGNLGNSIFVSAYLILVIPLAIARVIEHVGRASTTTTGRFSRPALYGGAILSFLIISGAWFLSFELGAKDLIEKNYAGTLTPDMLAAAQSSFTIALVITLFIVFAWWAAGLLWKKRTGAFLLVALYLLLLAFQLLTVVFSQSRGPLLGLLGGMFTFSVLFALVRGARKVTLGAMAAALLVLAFLGLFNLPGSSPFSSLRDLPYVGRLGRVMETEGGTGKVRVLIWQGALQLVLPHQPLWSPTTGSDALNPIRPLIGYGPETLSVAYNAYYPADLAHLESRNAAPDRAHNETFDALITTGLLGWIAENILFLAVLYYGLKWLGLITTPRERNTFVGLWYACGGLVAVALGLALGWHYIGVGLPAGMILGFFIYLAAIALLRPGHVKRDAEPWRSLLLVTFLAIVVAHFIEIHFGIAIVTTRTYFWFFSALLVVTGTGAATEAARLAQPVPVGPAEPADANRARRRKSRRAGLEEGTPRGTEVRAGRGAAPSTVSTGSLITLAFLAGLILATMSFDYITTISVTAESEGSIAALSIIANALTLKATTAGLMSSNAMAWLFIGSLLVMLGISVAEWGRTNSLPLREWLIAAALFAALAVAILSSFLLYHTLLIASAAAGVVDALFVSISLFVIFLLIMVAVVALTLLMDQKIAAPYVLRPANWVVAPTLLAIALILLFSTNVSAVQADMVYKQAIAESGGDTLPQSVVLFQRALALQPNQDYYWLFLGRAYLDQAKAAQDSQSRQQSLEAAQDALLRAQALNPLNTDHTANLARLHQAWAQLGPAADQAAQFNQSLQYYASAIRLSPNTVYLYDQYAGARLDYAGALEAARSGPAASEQRQTALDTLNRSLQIDPEFCLTYGVRASALANWRASAADAFKAIQLSNTCDVYGDEGRSAAMAALEDAGNRAAAAGEGNQYTQLLNDEVHARPSIQVYTALLNRYSKDGQIDQALQATDSAIALIPTADANARKQYDDFRKGLVDLQGLIQAARSKPNDPQAHRKLAEMWQARQQPQYALPEYQEVVQLSPDDYEARRRVVLLSLQVGQIAQATQALSATIGVAPLNDRPFWDRLSKVLEDANSGSREGALGELDALIQTVDTKDTLAMDSLKALRSRLQE